MKRQITIKAEGVAALLGMFTCMNSSLKVLPWSTRVWIKGKYMNVRGRG